uniref:DUF834 domain-containing protein n=1 Tax=Oryza rufipogon TaxID=4529 RepID=A0A0E0PC71_ORYRU
MKGKKGWVWGINISFIRLIQWGESVTPTTVSGGGAAKITQSPRANCVTCCGGRGNSEAPTVIRVEVPGAALRPWVWVLPGFTTNGSTSGLVDRERPHGRRKRRERRGAGTLVVERLRRRRQNMFPSDAHPGRVGGDRNGDGNSLLRQQEEVAVMGKGKGKGVKWIRLV